VKTLLETGMLRRSNIPEYAPRTLLSWFASKGGSLAGYISVTVQHRFEAFPAAMVGLENVSRETLFSLSCLP